MFITTSWSSDPVFDKTGQRSRSHGHIMYTAEMCYNSAWGGSINFVIGGWHEDDPSTSGA